MEGENKLADHVSSLTRTCTMMDNPWATDSWQPPDPISLSDTPNDDWGTTWGIASSSETNLLPPDQWEAPHQEEESPARAEVRSLCNRTLQLIP